MEFIAYFHNEPERNQGTTRSEHNQSDYRRKIGNMPYIDVCTNDSYKQRLTEGGSIGDIYVTGLKRDHQGQIYVNPQNGSIQADSETGLKQVMQLLNITSDGTILLPIKVFL